MSRRSIVFLMLLLVAAAGPAGARSLWTAGPDGLQFDGDLLNDVFAKSARQFEVAVDGRNHAVQVQTVSPPNLGVTSLFGRMVDRPGSFVLLCRTETGAVVAFLQPGDGTSWRLDRTSGRDELRQVDGATFGSCGGAVDPSALRGSNRGEDSVPLNPSLRMDKAGPTADDGSRQDIIVAYTPAAETVMGGWDQIRAEAQLAVDAANLTYANSAITTRLRLVYTISTSYSESVAWNYEDHLYYLYDPADGYMDELPPLRDRVGADFLCLLIDGQDSLGDVYTCGIAPVMQPEDLNGDFAPLALSVVSVQCATDNWTLSHEVGHNRGCAHDRDNSSVDGAYTYAYGHRFDGTNGVGYRTVMSYDNANGDFTRVPHYSHPGIDYAGTPTGVAIGAAGEAHNAQVHANTAAQCAAFRVERTFVSFGWPHGSTGFLLAPYPDIAQALTGSRDHGAIVLQNSNTGFTGVMTAPRLYVHDGAGSATLGGN